MCTLLNTERERGIQTFSRRTAIGKDHTDILVVRTLEVPRPQRLSVFVQEANKILRGHPQETLRVTVWAHWAAMRSPTTG